jgi:mono/diheme cytochrome c family protein
LDRGGTGVDRCGVAGPRLDEHLGATTAVTDAAQQLFAERGCAACHGARGEGDGTNPNTKLAGTRYILGQFQQRVRNGKGSAMPAAGPDTISDADVSTLHDWLQSLSGD